MAILLVNKPKGISSHGVVDWVRRATGEKRVGHGGTLDPNASGLLIVGVGREFTKKLGEITKNTDKTYTADIHLGKRSSTDDAEGEITFVSSRVPKLSEVEKVTRGFVGVQMQTPPPYSAIKIKGKKAYELARQGKKVKLKERKVTIYNIKLISYDYPRLVIECKVSSGTYIRALARDIGEILGTGAFLENLKRIKIGKYNLSDALELDKIGT